MGVIGRPPRTGEHAFERREPDPLMPRKRDNRTFITVHDGLPDHPKIEGLSDAAFRLLIETWCWCSRHLTDGKVTAASWVKRGTPRARRELVDAGLAVVDADGDVAMHDYLEHQRSAAEVAELSAARSEAGRKGGKTRAKRQATGKQPLKQVLEQDGSKTQAESETDTDVLLDEAHGGPAPPAPARRRRQVGDDFEITPGMRAWAAENVPGIDLDAETAQFLDYHQARASVMADWTKAWHTWMRNARKFNQRNGNGPPASSSVRLDPSQQDYSNVRI